MCPESWAVLCFYVEAKGFMAETETTCLDQNHFDSDTVMQTSVQVGLWLTVRLWLPPVQREGCCY